MAKGSDGIAGAQFYVGGHSEKQQMAYSSMLWPGDLGGRTTSGAMLSNVME